MLAMYYLLFKSLEYSWLRILSIGAFQRVSDDVEQKLVVINLEIFPLTLSHCSLPLCVQVMIASTYSAQHTHVGVVAPEERAITRRVETSQHAQHARAVKRRTALYAHTARFEQCLHVSSAHTLHT
jgi:hypothetical protein